jgi:hypothetical protein
VGASKMGTSLVYYGYCSSSAVVIAINISNRHSVLVIESRILLIVSNILTVYYTTTIYSSLKKSTSHRQDILFQIRRIT